MLLNFLLIKFFLTTYVLIQNYDKTANTSCNRRENIERREKRGRESEKGKVSEETVLLLIKPFIITFLTLFKDANNNAN